MVKTGRELELKKRLLAVARKCIWYRLIAGTWGNLSVRLDEDKMIITPSGFEKSALTVRDLLVMSLDGKILKGKWKPTIETPMHLKIYNSRKDVKAIVHTHSPYATVFAVANESIPVQTVEAASAIGHPIPVTDYVRAGTEEMAEEVVRVLGEKGIAVLIRNHGVVAVGETLEDAFHAAILVEEEARTYYLTKLLGKTNPIPPEEVEILRRSYLTSYGQKEKKVTIKL